MSLGVQRYLLACLAEECAEVTQRIGKALRFGIDDADPTIPDAPTERVLIKSELTDLLAVVEMLMQHDILASGWDRNAIREKKVKVQRFAEYARARGMLE